mmetsp:Transcript_13023/g.23621  ORF Transcript_13023/g.23621 Transcript_13023/m.23621 type:complete len:575 (-) Transcript_13023:1062-2786(-)
MRAMNAIGLIVLLAFMGCADAMMGTKLRRKPIREKKRAEPEGSRRAQRRKQKPDQFSNGSPTISPSAKTTRPTQPPTRERGFRRPKNPTLLFAPTAEPTQNPTNVPTDVPTDMPTEPHVIQPVRTGEACVYDGSCSSGVCGNGVCQLSPECKTFKHEYGSSLNSQKINIVFVGSGFQTTTNPAWKNEAERIYSEFKYTNMFSDANSLFNAFYVDQLEDSFCQQDYKGIQSLLYCNTLKAHDVASKCVPDGPNRQVVVVHNTQEYGGGGFYVENVATTTTHNVGPRVAIHELGHSLFELSDEYEYSSGRDGANCDHRKDCSRWADLIGNEKVESVYGEVSCIPGCQKGESFVGSDSLMNRLDANMGAVNERYTCCTFLAHTGSQPEYCNVFDFSENYLRAFCQNKDFQDYYIGKKNTLRSNNVFKTGKQRQLISQQNTHIYLESPQLVKVVLGFNSPNDASFVKNLEIVGSSQPGLYMDRWVEGDFASVEEAAKMGFEWVVRVDIELSTGQKQVLFFSDETMVHIPPSPPGENMERVSGDSVQVKVPELKIAIEVPGAATIELIEADIVMTSTGS